LRSKPTQKKQGQKKKGGATKGIPEALNVMQGLYWSWEEDAEEQCLLVHEMPNWS